MLRVFLLGFFLWGFFCVWFFFCRVYCLVLIFSFFCFQKYKVAYLEASETLKRWPPNHVACSTPIHFTELKEAILGEGITFVAIHSYRQWPSTFKVRSKNSSNKQVIKFMFVLSSGQLLCLRWKIQSCDFNLCRVALIMDIFRQPHYQLQGGPDCCWEPRSSAAPEPCLV